MSIRIGFSEYKSPGEVPWRTGGVDPVTAEEVDGLFRAAAATCLRGILGIEERALVSIDFKSDPRSAIVDAPSTMVVDGAQLKGLVWYDNEMGCVHGMMDPAQKVASSLP